jgi:hypothetical protein
MKIRYITPFSSERNAFGCPNIGGEYNLVISEVPDDCYIVLRDQDTLPLTSDFGAHIERIIKDNPDYDLITCFTNRIAIPELCISSLFNETDITAHIEQSKTSWARNGSSVVPFHLCPGYLMIFSKSTWAKAGGFKNYSITFDKEFSASVMKTGGKIGIATGLYLFHLYRWGKAKPEHSVNHLIGLSRNH